MENTPIIRFKGFTDAWEQCKLESLCDVFTDGDWIEAKDQSDSGVRLVQTGNVGNTEYLDKENNKKWISEETFERLHCKEIYAGDILISRLPEPTGRACIMPDLGTRMITAVDCTIVRTSKEYDSKYLVQYLSTPMYFKVVNSFLGGGTRQRISRGNLSEIDIPIPSTIEEQKEIGEYFANLDNLITLHQRKCDEVKELKSFMLQKMFPKNSESYPEIRFEGFTEAWEQRKLGEVFKQTSNFVNPSDDNIELWSLTVEDGLTPKSERYNREFLVKKDDNFKEVRPGDIVYNPMNMTLGAVGYNGMAKSVAVSGYYTTMIARENYDSYYINTWLKSPQAILLYRTYATGSLIEKQRVQYPTLSIIPVLFPKYEEQKRIGEYISNLDNLITLHQRKCDGLREMKKFMLRNMFV